MMKLGVLFAAAAVLTAAGNAAAMEADDAKAYLQGTWSAASETWIFTEDRWQQFNGGVKFDTTFKVETLPAQMFTVVSIETGRRYVVHANPQFNSMTWFLEGETQQIGFFTRQKEESPKP